MICVSATACFPVSLAIVFVPSLPLLLALRFMVGVLTGFAIVITYTMGELEVWYLMIIEYTDNKCNIKQDNINLFSN